MAKEIEKFEIIIRGTVAGGPVEMVKQYRVQDTADPDLGAYKTAKVASPDFNKTCHNTGAAGELWKDAVAAALTVEGIS